MSFYVVTHEWIKLRNVRYTIADCRLWPYKEHDAHFASTQISDLSINCSGLDPIRDIYGPICIARVPAWQCQLCDAGKCVALKERFKVWNCFERSAISLKSNFGSITCTIKTITIQVSNCGNSRTCT